MSVINIRTDDHKIRLLKIIASIEGKPMGSIVSELIDEYINKNKRKIEEISEKEELMALMKLSEKSFSEWDNDEDEIYNEL